MAMYFSFTYTDKKNVRALLLALPLWCSLVLCLSAWLILTPSAAGVEVDKDANKITLPPTIELNNLADLVSKSLGVSVQFGEGKVSGSVWVSLAQPVGGQELWSVFHQLLTNGGLTTVIADLPPVYHIVALSDAPQHGRILSPEDLATLTYQPGYQVVVYDLSHLSAEVALKIFTAVFTTPAIQIRSLGGDGKRLLFAAPLERHQEAQALLKAIDRPGMQPAVGLMKPERTSPAALQASTVAAWNALGRVDESQKQAEILIAPDGLQLMLVATNSNIELLTKIAQQLDQTEPVETKSYRPRFFALEEVANLINQTMKKVSATPITQGVPGLEIVRDNLTGSLIIQATAAEHERIAKLIKSLDEAPATARRQARSIQVKHRKADEISRMVMALISAESNTGSNNSNPGATTMAATPPPAQQTNPFPSTNANNGVMSGQSFSGNGGSTSLAPVNLPPPPTTAPASISQTADGSLLITADPVTNRLLILGEPRIIDQVEKLVLELDKYQPQVDIEFTMVTLTDDQSRSLGVELVHQFGENGTTTDITSLFGLSQGTAGDSTARAIGNATGLGTVVLKPGQYAAVVRALETVSDGRSVIKSQMVVNNNTQATLNGVIQQPLTSLNSSTQIATTSYAGTSDAGTQITVSPQISPADYVTLTYSLSQSAFIGESIVTENSVIPPTKRNDNVASTATVPDGYVIALGGLSNHSTGKSESRIPLLGNIPFFGALFRSRNSSDKDSRFFVFIRVSILRRGNFSDLRYLSEQKAKDAAVDTNLPSLEPQFIR
jgi:general secretion pathway protein D